MWLKTTRFTHIRKNEIYIWKLALDEVSLDERMNIHTILSQDEIIKANKFRY